LYFVLVLTFVFLLPPTSILPLTSRKRTVRGSKRPSPFLFLVRTIVHTMIQTDFLFLHSGFYIVPCESNASPRALTHLAIKHNSRTLTTHIQHFKVNGLTFRWPRSVLPRFRLSSRSNIQSIVTSSLACIPSRKTCPFVPWGLGIVAANSPLLGHGSRCRTIEPGEGATLIRDRTSNCNPSTSVPTPSLNDGTKKRSTTCVRFLAGQYVMKRFVSVELSWPAKAPYTPL